MVTHKILRINFLFVLISFNLFSCKGNVISPTSTPFPISNRTQTSTPTKASTMSMLSPTGTLIQISETLSNSRAPITFSNIYLLNRVAIYGKGSIKDLVVSSDGNFFILVSAFGYAIFDIFRLSDPPIWKPFNEPIDFQKAFIDSENKLLLLTDENLQPVVFNIESGKMSDVDINDLKWPIYPFLQIDDASVVLYKPSPYGKYEFISWGVVENIPSRGELFSKEKTDKELFAHKAGFLYYDLNDSEQYIRQTDFLPNGCELDYSGSCGGELLARVMYPMLVEFSSDNNSYVILNGFLDKFRSKDIGYIRIYNRSDGKLFNWIGDDRHFVIDFAFIPNTDNLIVVFNDGSFQIQNIYEQNPMYKNRYFDSPAANILFANNNQYYLIQREDTLEVRRLENGELLSRFETSVSDASTKFDMAAYVPEDGKINIFDIPSGRTIVSIDTLEKHLYALAFSPSGDTLISSSEDCTVMTWDVNNGSLINSDENTCLNPNPFSDPKIFREFTYYFEFIYDTNQLIESKSWSSLLSRGIESDSIEKLITPQPLGCNTSGVKTKDGKLRFTRGFDSLEGQICILDNEDLQFISSIDVIPRTMNSKIYVSWPYISPDGRYLVVPISDGTIYIYAISS